MMAEEREPAISSTGEESVVQTRTDSASTDMIDGEPVLVPTTDEAAEARDLRLYDTDHDGRLNHIERTIKRYDTNGDGSFSTTEVKAIVQDLENAKREARSMYHLSVGILVASAMLFGALFAIMIAANEVSKDTHPSLLSDSSPGNNSSSGRRRQLVESDSAFPRQVVLQDNFGNIVATDSTPKWNSKVTSLANALQVPDAQPVFALDHLSTAQLSQLRTLTVDTSTGLDGSDLTIYSVTAVRAWRPPPGASGRPNPPEITVQTATGDTIQVKNGQAVIRSGDGKLKHTLTAQGAAQLRRRRRLLQESETGVEIDSDRNEPGRALERVERARLQNLPPSPPPPSRPRSGTALEPQLSWRDVTAQEIQEKRRRLNSHEHDRSGSKSSMDPQAFVRRRQSNTSFVFELSHSDKPTNFDGHHHGIETGSIISLPICTAAGLVKQFKLHPGDTIPDELQRAFPNVRSYHATEWPSGAANADVTVDSTGVRAQIWNGADQLRCFVDPHTNGRADKYTVYSEFDRREDDSEFQHTPMGDDGETFSGTPGELGLNTDEDFVSTMLDEQHPGWRDDEVSASDDGNAGGYYRQLRDVTVDGANPPAGRTFVRTYSLCIAASPSYVAYGQQHHPTDGALGLIVTTIARSSGIWRRAMGISFVLCKKQAQLLLPNQCQADEVAARSGCGSDMEQCWCTSSGGNTCNQCARGNIPEDRYLHWCECEPDQCKAPTDCNFGGYRCFADAIGCNILPDNAINQVIDSLSTMLDRMGVHAASDYDIAHYFTVTPSSSGEGLGGAGVCGCVNGESNCKARGASGARDPQADSFSAGIFAHEVGHQFSQYHTFGGTGGNCNSWFDERQAVEVGSGVTVLSYGGTCNDGQRQRPYFHAVTLRSIAQYLQHPDPHGYDFTRCGTMTNSSNHRPDVTVISQCRIPRSTPYYLFGTATDVDGDQISYNWEQMDAANKQVSVSIENKGDGPGHPTTAGALFKSLEPSTDGNVRYIPRLSTQLSFRGTSTQDWLERTSTMERDLHVTLTARDHYSSTGSGCRGVAGCADNDLDTPSGAQAVGSFHSMVTTITVAPVGPLTWVAPAAPANVIATGTAPICDFTDCYSCDETTCTGPPPTTQFSCNHDSQDCPAWVREYGCPHVVALGHCGRYCQLSCDNAMPDSCMLAAEYDWRRNRIPQLETAAKACRLRKANHTEIATGKLEIVFQLAGVDVNAPDALTQAAYSIEYASGNTVEQVETVAARHETWKSLPGASALPMHSTGRAVATILVPWSLANRYCIFRVVSTSTSDAATSAAACQAHAMSPTFFVTQGPYASPELSSTVPFEAATEVPRLLTVAYNFNSNASAIFFAPDDVGGPKGVQVLLDGTVFRSIASSELRIVGYHQLLIPLGTLQGSTTYTVAPDPGLIASATTGASVNLTNLSFTTGDIVCPHCPTPNVSSTSPTTLTDVSLSFALEVEATVDVSASETSSAVVVTSLGHDAIADESKATTICTLPAQMAGLSFSAKKNGFSSDRVTIQSLGYACAMHSSWHYRIVFAAGALVSSLGQVATTANITWTLKIASESTPPSLQTTTPVAGATDIPARTTVDFEFTEDIYVADRCQQIHNATPPIHVTGFSLATLNGYYELESQLVNGKPHYTNAEGVHLWWISDEHGESWVITADLSIVHLKAYIDSSSATPPAGTQHTWQQDLVVGGGGGWTDTTVTVLDDCAVTIFNCNTTCNTTRSYSLVRGVHDIVAVSGGFDVGGGVRIVSDAKQLTLFTGDQPLLSDTSYHVAIPHATLSDASGNFFSGSVLQFTTGDFSSPEVRSVTITQPVAGGDVFATLHFDEGQDLHTGTGLIYAVDTQTGDPTVTIGIPTASADHLQFNNNKVTILVNSAELIPGVVYAIRWSYGILIDAHGNGIHANPNPGDETAHRNRYNFTASAPLELDASDTYESMYNCADPVHEEVLLSHFDNIAPPASNGGMASIEITSGSLRDFREKMGEATHGRVFSSAEARQMLEEIDINSDGAVTAAEFVTYECAALQNGDTRVSNDTCQWQEDGICDEPALCPPGTDVVDCAEDDGALPLSCDYINDGECDEGVYCAYGTDAVDCASANDAQDSGSDADRAPVEDTRGSTPVPSAGSKGGAARGPPYLQMLIVLATLASVEG